MESAEWVGQNGADMNVKGCCGLVYVHCTRKVATYVRAMHVARCCTVVCAPFTSVA